MEDEKELEGESKKKKKKSKVKAAKEKEALGGNKFWVVLVLMVSVLISLFFVYKGRKIHSGELFPKFPNWFGSSTYEFTN